MLLRLHSAPICYVWVPVSNSPVPADLLIERICQRGHAVTMEALHAAIAARPRERNLVREPFRDRCGKTGSTLNSGRRHYGRRLHSRPDRGPHFVASKRSSDSNIQGLIFSSSTMRLRATQRRRWSASDIRTFAMFASRGRGSTGRGITASSKRAAKSSHMPTMM